MTLLNQNSILDYTPSQLQAWLTEQGYPGYHTRQIFQWLYQRKVTDFDDMSDLSKSLRLQLKESFYIETPPIRARQEDPGDGTVKCLFQLRDEEAVEAVLMPRYPERVKTNPRTGEIQDRKNLPVEGYTTCLSTQVGCMYACRFCASGQLGLKRNMTAGEMVAQVMAFHRQEKPVSRIVFMGTGEPLHNIDSLRRAIEILTHKDGLNFSSRRITVSTVGLVPEIYRIGREGWKVKLAISLHATTDEKRSNIMPLARAYHLDQLKDALKYYQRCNGRRISFEYLLLGGVNDSPKDAERLQQFCHELLCHVNLIPYNSISKSTFRPSNSERIQNFRNCLRSGKIDVTVRYSRGRNIDAACGQLRLRHESESVSQSSSGKTNV